MDVAHRSLRRPGAVAVPLLAAGLLSWPVGAWLLGLVLRPTASGGTLLFGVVGLSEEPSEYLGQAVGLRVLVSSSLFALGALAAVWPSMTARMSATAASDRSGAVFAAGLVVLLAVIYLPAGTVWYPSHDFLDSEFVYKVLRGDSPGWFDLDHVIEPLMGGIPLSAFGLSDVNPLLNLYVVLDPFLAFSVGEIVARLAAFVGMYLLLSRHLITSRTAPVTIPGAVATLFALLPFWEHQTATIAFQPLHVVAILALRDGASRMRWLPVAAVYPLVADGLRGGILLVALPLLLVLWDATHERRAEARNLLLPAILTIAVAMVGLIRPAHLILATDFVSHRTDWPTATAPLVDAGSAGGFLRELGSLLLLGQYHMGGGPFLLPVLSLALLVGMLMLRASSKPMTRPRMPLLSMFAATVALVSVISAAEESGLTNIAGVFPIPLRVSRVVALAPSLWLIILALSLERLAALGRRRLVAVLLVGTVAQAALGAFGLIPKLTGGRAEPIGSAATAGPPSNMRDYYRLEQYQQVSELLGADATVVSFDIDPMIAAFHGISTLDGYSFNYPLEHKRRFRAIISGELDRDRERREYFDDFGSRAYLFFAERAGGELFLDFCAAAEMGATHVIARGLEPVDGVLASVGAIDDVAVLRLAEPCEGAGDG